MASVAFRRGFGGINSRNEVKKIFEHTFQNRHFRPPKIREFGLGRTGEKSADSDANSESVTTLRKCAMLFLDECGVLISPTEATGPIGGHRTL